MGRHWQAYREDFALNRLLDSRDVLDKLLVKGCERRRNFTLDKDQVRLRRAEGRSVGAERGETSRKRYIGRAQGCGSQGQELKERKGTFRARAHLDLLETGLGGVARVVCLGEVGPLEPNLPKRRRGQWVRGTSRVAGRHD
eukprot:scaffold101330_cov28-Tisochrysis_lutea.AAC.1